MPPALAARVSHVALYENGSGFIWNGPSQEMYIFTTGLKLPTPDKGQRSYHWANDEMAVSTFPYLPFSYHVRSRNQSAQTWIQSVGAILTYGGKAGDDFITLLLMLYETSPWYHRGGNRHAYIPEQGKTDWQCCPWLGQGNSCFRKLWKKSKKLKHTQSGSLFPYTGMCTSCVIERLVRRSLDI